MKVEVNSQALADAVAWTTRVIDARPATPILAGIRLEAIDGTLQLSAFNYAISARHHIEAGVDEAGSVLVLGKLLADITKSLPAAKTYLSTDGSTMTITSGKSTFTMQLMPGKRISGSARGADETGSGGLPHLRSGRQPGVRRGLP